MNGSAAPEFFHRVDGLNLVPGNKTAGFDLVVSTEVLQRLRDLPTSDAEMVYLYGTVKERLRNAQLLPEGQLEWCGIGFIAGTWCPRFFATGPEGASIGAVPEELDRLRTPDARAWIGPTLVYSPHNVDSPAQAMALLVMSETWAELARFALQSAAQHRE